MRRFILGAALLALSACATAPAKVAPAYVSPLQFEGASCEQLLGEMARVRGLVADAAKAQGIRADTDAILMNVALVAFWPALLAIPGGNQTGELASLKGGYEALTVAANAKGCIPDPEPLKPMSELP